MLNDCARFSISAGRIYSDADLEFTFPTFGRLARATVTWDETHFTGLAVAPQTNLVARPYFDGAISTLCLTM